MHVSGGYSGRMRGSNGWSMTDSGLISKSCSLLRKPVNHSQNCYTPEKPALTLIEQLRKRCQNGGMTTDAYHRHKSRNVTRSHSTINHLRRTPHQLVTATATKMSNTNAVTPRYISIPHRTRNVSPTKELLLNSVPLLIEHLAQEKSQEPDQKCLRPIAIVKPTVGDHVILKQSEFEPLKSEPISEPTRVDCGLTKEHRRYVEKLSIQLVQTYELINKAHREVLKCEISSPKITSQPAAEVIVPATKVNAENDTNGSIESAETPATIATKARSARVLPHIYDDKNGNYIVKKGEVWLDTWVIEDTIGQGSFGQVVRAIPVSEPDEDSTNGCVAIKIIKNDPAFLRQAKIEVELLRDMQKMTEKKRKHVVDFKKCFTYRDHLCLVFELLSYDLYALLKNTQFRGVSLNLTRKFGIQICGALEFLKNAAIIHCDIKPENILLIHPKRSTIKLIDFGSSCYKSQPMYQYIQSRFYRSPEIILGKPYGPPIDMWSCGCVLYELHTGQPLFGGVNEFDQLRRIVQLLGVPPKLFLDEAPKTRKFFNKTFTKTSTVEAKNEEEDSIIATTEQYVYTLRKFGAVRKKPDQEEAATLETLLGDKTGGPYGKYNDMEGHSLEDYTDFIALLNAMLTFEPEDRMAPAAANLTPFLKRIVPDTTRKSDDSKTPTNLLSPIST